MSFFLHPRPDFGAHNEEVKRVWDAHRRREPLRPPVVVVGSIRNYIQNPALNNTGYTFQDFFTNPKAQITCQLEFQKWVRFNILCDQEMGLPVDGWRLNVDIQNTYDAGWFGCPLHYGQPGDNDVPDTRPILGGNKSGLYSMTCPDPLRGGVLGLAMDHFDYMQEECPRLEYEGLPVLPPQSMPGEGTDGPFTVACNMRGVTGLLLDMLSDPDYFHDLMSFVTDCIIERMTALRRWRWQRNPDAEDAGRLKGAFGFADDSIALLSVDQYAESVLPYHKRLVDAFSDGSHIGMHLCGNATHLFRFLRDNLNVYSFDTGYPVDYVGVRQSLGPEVEIAAGPTVMEIKDGPVERIRECVRQICDSGIRVPGKFVMIAANNLAPFTPAEHIRALYDATREFGRYQ
jgi:uroporphyrinogen-III decarboxylase